MPIGVTGILSAVVTHAQSLGVFDSVRTHEPKSAPGPGVHCAIWLDEVEPVRSSGLSTTTVRVSYSVRAYSPMLQEPADDIDAGLLLAVDRLMAAYTGDFTLNGQIRSVDVFGADGTGLRAVAGYLDQDNRIYRVITVTLPLIANDVWEQVA